MQFATLIFVVVVSIIFSIVYGYKAEKRKKALIGLAIMIEALATMETEKIKKEANNDKNT